MNLTWVWGLIRKGVHTYSWELGKAGDEATGAAGGCLAGIVQNGCASIFLFFFLFLFFFDLQPFGLYDRPQLSCQRQKNLMDLLANLRKQRTNLRGWLASWLNGPMLNRTEYLLRNCPLCSGCHIPSSAVQLRIQNNV